MSSPSWTLGSTSSVHCRRIGTSAFSHVDVGSILSSLSIWTRSFRTCLRLTWFSSIGGASLPRMAELRTSLVPVPAEGTRLEPAFRSNDSGSLAFFSKLLLRLRRGEGRPYDMLPILGFLFRDSFGKCLVAWLRASSSLEGLALGIVPSLDLPFFTAEPKRPA